VKLELPSGLFVQEDTIDQSACAVQELAEEVGLCPVAPLELLGKMMPDTGRLENKMFAYLPPSGFNLTMDSGSRCITRIGYER